MLFKLSNLNSNLALTLGFLNPALNNSALMKNTTNSRENEKDCTGIAGQLTWCNNTKNRVWNLDEINVRSDDVKVIKSSWNFVKTKITTVGNNIYTLLITFIAFTSFISSKFQTLFFPYKLSYYATGGPYYAWFTCGETEYKSKKNLGIL